MRIETTVRGVKVCVSIVPRKKADAADVQEIQRVATDMLRTLERTDPQVWRIVDHRSNGVEHDTGAGFGATFGDDFVVQNEGDDTAAKAAHDRLLEESQRAATGTNSEWHRALVALTKKSMPRYQLTQMAHGVLFPYGRPPSEWVMLDAATNMVSITDEGRRYLQDPDGYWKSSSNVINISLDD